MNELKKMKKSLIVITGANAGIGFELAKLYAQAGHKVLGLDLKVDNIVLPNMHALAFDVASPESWKKIENHEFFTDEGLKRWPIGHWYNNAGIAGLGEASQQSIGDLQRVMDVNFWGAVRGTRFAYEKMKKSDQAHPRSIINISSMSAYIPAPMMSAYSASKAAIRNYSLSFQEEMQDVKIHVVTPGFVKTDILNSHSELRLPSWMLKRASETGPTAQSIIEEVLIGSREIVPDINGKRLYKLWRLGPSFTRKLSHYLLK